MKKIISFFAVILFLTACSVNTDTYTYTNTTTVSSFEECLSQGNVIMESYPPQCRTEDGEIFVQDIGNELEMSDEIMIDSPRPQAKVAAPLGISGQARGSWFFEGSLSAEILDINETVLGTAVLQATGEWMTEDFVPFVGEISFDAPVSTTGTLVIKNANPSGLPENSKELRIPVIF